MYVCMYVCMYALCMYVCMYACMYVRMYVSIYVSMYVFVLLSPPLRACVWPRVHARAVRVDFDMGRHSVGSHIHWEARDNTLRVGNETWGLPAMPLKADPKLMSHVFDDGGRLSQPHRSNVGRRSSPWPLLWSAMRRDARARATRTRRHRVRVCDRWLQYDCTTDMHR